VEDGVMVLLEKNGLPIEDKCGLFVWRVFQYWDPERIETIPLNKSEISRIGYIPVAIAKYTQNKALAQRFIDFLLSEEGKAIYRKYNYFMTPDEAFAWIGEKKPVGGEYVVPVDWLKK
jgi:molybdate transport system substrate-binding protein